MGRISLHGTQLLWEGVQPLKTKVLFPTCTLFDFDFWERALLVEN